MKRAFFHLLLGLVAAPLGPLGCNSSAAVQQGPSDTLRAYASALEQGRVDDAYRLLSDEAKRTMSLDAFRRAVLESPDDVREIAQSLARPTTDPLVTATVTVPNGDELRLIYEGGKWRVDSASVDLYGQATPRQALVGFLRAFDRGRYDILMRYVPDAEKHGLAPQQGLIADSPAPGAPPPVATTPEAPTLAPFESTSLTAEKLRASWEGPQKEQMSRIVQAIKAALPTATIEETGDSAAMAYGAGGTLSFLRERGAWKIQDF